MTLGEWLDTVIRDEEPARHGARPAQKNDDRRDDEYEPAARPRRFEQSRRDGRAGFSDDRPRKNHESGPLVRESRGNDRIDRRTEQALYAVERWLKDNDGRRHQDDGRLTEARDMLTRRLDHLDERIADGSASELGAMRDAMERLGQRIEDVAEVALKGGNRADNRFQAELERRVADIGRRIEDMNRSQSTVGAAGSARLDRLESMLVKVAASLDDRQKAMAERAVLNGPRRRSDLLSGSTANGPGGSPLAAAMADIRAHKLRLEQAASQRAEATAPAVAAQVQQAYEKAFADAAPALDTIRSEIAKLAGQISQTSHQPALESLRSELQGLRQVVADVAGRSVETQPALPEMLDEISARMQQEFAAINRTVAERLSATVQQDAVSPKLAQLVPALDGLSQRMETVGSRMATDLRRDFQTAIADLRQAVAQQRPGISMEPIEQAIRELSERMNGLASQPGVDSAVLVRTNLELAEIRELIAKVGNPLALDRIEKQIDALSQRVDTLSHSANRSDIESLSKELRHLARQFDPALSLSAMDEKLRALEERIGRKLESGQRLVAEQAALPADVLMPDVSGIERMIATLSQKIEAARAPDAGLPQLDALQHQIAQISSRLERSDEGIAALAGIERTVADLFTQMDSLRHEQREAAEIAARRAAEHLARDLPARLAGQVNESADPARLDALTDNVSALLEARETIDIKTQNTLEAVHTALERIVGRLGSLENEIARKETRPPEPLPVHAAIEAAGHAAQQIAKPPARTMEERIAGSRVAASPQLAARIPAKPEPAEAASTIPSVDPAVLAEPGKRRAQPVPPAPEPKPSRFALKLPFLKGKDKAKQTPAGGELPQEPAPEPAKTPATSGSDVPLEPGSGRPGHDADAGARLVAAARRAAQSAVSETAAAKPNTRADAGGAARAKVGKTTEAAGEAGSGFSLARRKKPILLGLAAIIIAALSINVLSSMINSGPAPESRQAAQAPAPAKEQMLATAPKKTDAGRVLPDQPAVKDNGGSQTSASADPPSVGSLVEPGKPLDITPGGSLLNPAPMNPPAQEAAAEKAAPPAPAATLASAPAGADVPPGITSPGLKTAVQRGDVTALYEIGNRLFEGRGVPRDPKAALAWFERAGNAGLVPAQFRVGNMYEKGTGVARDLKQARQWYGRAADKGNAKAIHNLGVIIAEGGDGKPDYAVAGDLFRRAAQFGIRDSQYNIAILLARGLGVGQSMTEAYTWFAIAAAQGDEEAGRKRDEVAARLSPDDLLAAKDAVAKFKPLPLDALANDVPERVWDGPSSPQAKPKTSNRVSGSARL